MTPTRLKPRTEAELVYRVLCNDGGWMTDELVASEVARELAGMDEATRRRLQVEWLMGFPAGWTDCEDLGTR